MLTEHRLRGAGVQVQPMLTACLAALRQTGVLLKSDPALPSVTTIVAGEPVRGSWWGHPAGRLIFQVLQELAAHPEVLLVKLVAAKDTLVHRTLWREVYAVGSAGEPSQRVRLSPAARALEEQIARKGELDSSGPAARELEVRLLVRAAQFHGGAGHHAKHLESWTYWADRMALDTRGVTCTEARAAFEAVLPAAKLPWHPIRGKASL